MDETEVTLDTLKPGRSGLIVDVTARGLLKRRLNDMGLVRGEVVKVDRVAPFGDPVKLIVKKYSLSLRKMEAGNIRIHVLG